MENHDFRLRLYLHFRLRLYLHYRIADAASTHIGDSRSLAQPTMTTVCEVAREGITHVSAFRRARFCSRYKVHSRYADY